MVLLPGFGVGLGWCAAVTEPLQKERGSAPGRRAPLTMACVRACMSVSSSYTEPRQPRWPGASQRRDHPARIDDDVLGLASDFMVVSSHAGAVGGLAAGPDE